MAAKRVKILEEREKAEESECEVVDRISKLPDPIIHHILSFIPTIDAVRTSLLSKHWRCMWYSVPALDLCDLHVGKDCKCDLHLRKDCKNLHFDKFVDNCLEARDTGMRSAADSSITRFKLRMRYSGRPDHVDKWLRCILNKNVEELDLCIAPATTNWRFGNFRYSFYSLPETIRNAQNLTFLKLDGLRMEGPFQVSLPALKLLFLKNIDKLNDHSFEDLLANCPSLETLVLKTCKALSTPHVSSSSIKSFQVELASDQTIKIDASNLQSLQVHASQNCKISLAACPSLRNLSLINVKLDDRWLEDFEALTIDSLTIDECDGLENINIKSEHLKSIVLCKGSSQQVNAITIDAQNLVLFTYKTRDISFYNISFNTPNLRVCNVNIDGYPFIDTKWYVNLLRLLSSLCCSKNMCLYAYSDEALIFPNYVRRNWHNYCLLSVEHMKVKTSCQLHGSSDLRDSLYWLSPSLKSLSIEQQVKGFCN